MNFFLVSQLLRCSCRSITQLVDFACLIFYVFEPNSNRREIYDSEMSRRVAPLLLASAHQKFNLAPMCYH
jgi:hypothetical protein